MTWVDLVRQYFPEVGDLEADYILWEKTCFPMGKLGQIEKQLREFAGLDKGVRSVADWEIVMSHDVDEDEHYDVISIYEDNDDEELICRRSIKSYDDRDRVINNFHHILNLKRINNVLISKIEEECGRCEINIHSPEDCEDCPLYRALDLVGKCVE